MIATYSIWQIGLVWILGSFLLGATWIVLVRIEVYLNRREVRSGRGDTGGPQPLSNGNGHSSEYLAHSPPPGWHLREEEIEFLISPLQGGRHRTRRERRRR